MVPTDDPDAGGDRSSRGIHVDSIATKKEVNEGEDNDAVVGDRDQKGERKIEPIANDEEGLRKHYDVILCGTGLVQSLLAAALARAGLTVLHVDATDYYGEFDAVWTFPYLQRLRTRKDDQEKGERQELRQEGERKEEKAPSHQRQDNPAIRDHLQITNLDELNGETVPFGTVSWESWISIHSRETTIPKTIANGGRVRTPYGRGVVLNDVVSGQDASGSLVIELSDWTLANDQHPQVYVGIPPSVRNFTTKDDEESHKGILETHLNDYLRQQHSIERETALLARTILEENSRSLAFDITPTAIYAAGSAVHGLLLSGVAEYLEWKAIEGLVYFNIETGTLDRVPCNKNDVFSSKLLSPMDKRRLMKFLQLAMDYGTALQEGDTEQVHSLNERHLNQGRSLARPQNKVVATTDLQLLQKSIAEGMEFDSYLTHQQQLSPKLRALVRYALALDSGTAPTTLEQGMQALCKHMGSLGRFGTTAFLVPLYGSGELPQAFCRSAAVYGATYLLRRCPRGITIFDDRVTGVILDMPKSEEEGASDSVADTSPIRTKVVSCAHAILPSLLLENPSESTCPQHSGQRIYRRISVVRGRPLGSGEEQQRHMIIIPPHSFGNETAIHGMILDEGMKVAPYVPGGCSVVHLTTTAAATGNIHTTTIPGTLEDAIDRNTQSLRDALASILRNNDVEEIFHTSFSYPIHHGPHSQVASRENIANLYLIRTRPPPMDADTAFDEARTIFSKICPKLDFLALSQSLHDTIKERLGDQPEPDDEQMVLESALGMIQK